MVTQDTEILSLATSVSGIASTVANLVNVSSANACAVSDMTQAFKVVPDGADSSDVDLFGNVIRTMRL